MKYSGVALCLSMVLSMSAQCNSDTDVDKSKSPTKQSCQRNGAQVSWHGNIYVCTGVRKNHSGHYVLKSIRRK